MISEKKKNGTGLKAKLSSLSVHAVLILAAISILAPLYIALVVSFMDKSEAMSPGFTLWPENFDIHGYIEVFTYTAGSIGIMPIVVRGFINTIMTVLPTTLIGTLVSALAAFSFSKLKFKGNSLMFSILLGTMMIPGMVSMIPSYIIFDKIGWVDTYLPLVVPGLFGAAGTVFFLRQFYFSIPNDLVEAARVDGLGNFGIFVRIMLPLSVPALITQFVMNFVGGYNEYLGALLYLFTPEKYTLQIALNFFRGTYSQDYAVIMAGAVVSLLPTTLIYLIGQRYFLEGIATSGMKL